MRAHYAAIVLIPLALLCGCAPRQSQVAGAIEDAWKEHPDDMAVLAGVMVADDKTGAAATLSNAARQARAIGQAYAGNVGGELLGGAISAGSSLVRSTGLSGAADVDDRLQLGMADRWEIQDLDVKEEHKSGDAYIVHARYSLYAHTSQGMRRVLLNSDQTVRLIMADGAWAVDLKGVEG